MKTLLISLLTLLASYCFSQQTINGTITHGSLQRSYILYVPASYSPSTAAPLVFNFHGYTNNSSQQIAYGEFRPIADTAGFLLVVPQGTVDGQGNTYWNANWGGTVDDIGFVEALIDSLSASYNINQNRVYSTGMSNGGFMSYVLACELSGRIAAIASVTGSMTLGDPIACSPTHPVPVLEIHGDADGTVPYTGSNFSESITDVVNHWVTFNNCNSTPVFTAVPNTNTSDNSTAEHYLYTGGNNCVEVEHYKILNGGHTWPGAPFNIGTTNRDINASNLIWQFFAKYDINGKIGGCTTTSIENLKGNEINVKTYPNPVQDLLTLKWGLPSLSNSTVKIFNNLGSIVSTSTVEKGSTKFTISTKKLNRGIYFVEIVDDRGIIFNSKVVLN